MITDGSVTGVVGSAVAVDAVPMSAGVGKKERGFGSVGSQQGPALDGRGAALFGEGLGRAVLEGDFHVPAVGEFVEFGEAESLNDDLVLGKLVAVFDGFPKNGEQFLAGGIGGEMA
jgi:hypothetical protein